jgi:hypothetical protein
MKRLAAAVLAVAVATPAAAKKVAGVDFPQFVEVSGQKLRLNGAGVRRKFVVKVYAGGLYLAQPSRDPQAIVGADAARRIRMVFLRDVTKKQAMDSYREGIEKNSPRTPRAELLPKLDQLGTAIPDTLKERSEMLVTYVPGQGTTVEVTGGGTATVPGKDFADAMFRIWLGDSPADEDLKAAMLAGE